MISKSRIDSFIGCVSTLVFLVIWKEITLGIAFTIAIGYLLSIIFYEGFKNAGPLLGRKNPLDK